MSHLMEIQHRTIEIPEEHWEAIQKYELMRQKEERGSYVRGANGEIVLDLEDAA